MSFATSDESGKRTEKGKQGTRDLQRPNTREAARCWALGDQSTIFLAASFIRKMPERFRVFLHFYASKYMIS